MITFKEFIAESYILDESNDNILLSGDKAIRTFEKTSDKMTDSQKEKALEKIYDDIFPELEKRMDSFKKFVKTVSKKYRGSELKFRIKPLKSVVNKVVGRGKSLSSLSDLLGGMLLIDKPEDVDKAVADIKRKFDNYVVDVEKKELGKSETGKNDRSGYHGAYHIDINMNGVVGELQVMSKKLAKQKNLAHTIYTSTRTKGASERELEMMRKFFVKGNMKEEFYEIFDSFEQFEDLLPYLLYA